MSGQAIASTFAVLSRLGKTYGRYLWIAGVILYLGFIWYVGWEDVGSALDGLDFSYLAALMLVEVIALGMRVWKWRIALGPRQKALRACFISKAGGNLTPARIGELSPLLLEEHRSARVGAWIVLDRVLEAAATLVLGLVGLVAVLGLAGGGGLTWWALALLATLGGATYLFTNSRFMEALSARFDPAGLIGRGFRLLGPVSREMSELGPKVPILVTLTLSATLLDLVIGYLLFMCFGIGVALTVLALAQLVHALVSSVPIAPNASGIPYAAAAAVIYETAGIPIEVLTVAIGLRFLIASGVFWGGFLFAVTGRQGRSRFTSQSDLFDHLASGAVLYEYAPGALEKLDALVEGKGKLLDIGCGDGVIAQALDADVTMGVDLSPRCARLARDRGLMASVGDAAAGLPFRTGSLDTVTCFDVLHHLGQVWDEIFVELDRVLRPGGRICIVEPDARNPFVRWTQAPGSPIRVAPWRDEPAIDPIELIARLEGLGYEYTCESIHIEGRQTERSVFPMWQRLLKAPFVILLAWYFRSSPNKFALVARKPAGKAERAA